MILKFNEFLTEKLGVNSDVTILVDVILSEITNIKNNKLFIKNIPKQVSFNIHKIEIKLIDTDKFGAFLDISRSKNTKFGYDLYIVINKNTEIKSALYHELTHVIKFVNLTSKKIMMFSPIDNYYNKDFSNLLELLYYSDESEINAKIAELYSKVEDLIDQNNTIDKKIIFKNHITELIKDEYGIPYRLINYNIDNDLNGINLKEKLLFFRYITNDKNIKSKSNSKFSMYINMIKTVLFNNHNITELDLKQAMKRTQTYINTQGIKLENKMMKLYGLLEK